MKSIKDILRHKNIFSRGENKAKPDEKTIAKVFKEVTLAEIGNLSPEDLHDVYIKNKIILIRTAHPAIASEIWRRRQKIIEKANQILRGTEINEIKVK